MTPTRTLLPLSTLLVFSVLVFSVGCETIDDGLGGGSAAFSTIYGATFQRCAGCHAPGAPGATSSTEKSLDFSSEASAKATLTGTAKGLTGNAADCNGVPFVVPGKPAQSLLIAALDETARQNFDLPSNPNCDFDAISDMAGKLNPEPTADEVAAIRDWIASQGI